ncbi:uracil-DNA glycosylase [Thalassotalea profundi]|uniref:Uracil-DNA glycosylase n=1 Tax=Thalassotalea profundi TaxID=2036687 RepID=A0ABQ3IUG0_9GAMM|nr:uracil-DNA glycosylase [Thalassotalea profundi]GHE94684.1 uracil-DNA glycosylase [Thalassotalea profundi]
MKIPPSWQSVIEQEQNKAYFKKLETDIKQQRANAQVIFPEEEHVFSAFQYCDLPNVKVVILGQDPYHGVGQEGQPQAHGLAFSVQSPTKTPPSLVNIYKELTQDINNFKTPEHGNLTAWAKQGVLLLNTVLTVKQGQANSHAKLGWETFTDAIIDAINVNNKGCVFMLWGSHAQKKGKHIDSHKHYVLSGPHPSPLSAYRGFFGCQHFSKANNWLEQHGIKSINWCLS